MSSAGQLARWIGRCVVLGVIVWLVYVTAPVLGWEAQGQTRAVAPVADAAAMAEPSAAAKQAPNGDIPPPPGLDDALDEDYGPDVVVLDELVDQYDPVPFNHRGHAKMAEMWEGCVTCHHHTPQEEAPRAEDAADAADARGNVGARGRSGAVKHPPCRECHSPAVEDATVQMPGLKGAYHRQCLNCHKEWMHANACVVCHLPRDLQNPQGAPTRDDIVGRMHPPIPEPEVKVYRARLTPADGPNVTFRHKEHTARFGLKCVNCHRRDNCSSCHDAQATQSHPQVMKPGRTWQESHEPCANCHRSDRCSHCHYRDGQPAPPPFDHTMTGQLLDANHANLACAKCHLGQRFVATRMTCGDASCHGTDKSIAYPANRPGPMVCRTLDAPPPHVEPEPEPAPTTRAVIKRIRR